MNTMNEISNEVHRNTLINDIRYQAWLWNQAVMHDGTGKIINLYEVGENESSLPGKINNKKVVEIRCETSSIDSAGEFSPSELIIRISYLNSASGDRPGRNVDTPMHEMGHLLGLNDLDIGISSGTHKTLMGYNRETTESSIGNAITYHDIQGIAVLNGKHTSHSFKRYFKRDGKYLHVCFYCDTIDSTSSRKSESLQLEDAVSCTHDYKQLVSLGNKHWVKCNKCYKVITHSHEYTSYTWKNLRQHIATCYCGASTLLGHAVSSNIYASGNKYATCLLCGGKAEIGFIQMGSCNRNEQLALKGNFVLPNGVIVLNDGYIEKYFNKICELEIESLIL